MNNFDIFVKSTIVGAGFSLGVIIGIFIFLIITTIFLGFGDLILKKKGNK